MSFKERVMTLREPRQRLRIDPALNPKRDEEWMRLAEACLKGDVPVFFAGVPLVLCVPFDLDYRPDLHPAGRQAIDTVKQDWINQRPHYLVVYPRGKWFVVSDDYIQLFAALEGRPDYLPCWVLGRPDNDMVLDVQGPIAQEDVRTIMGFA